MKANGILLFCLICSPCYGDTIDDLLQSKSSVRRLGGIRRAIKDYADDKPLLVRKLSGLVDDRSINVKRAVIKALGDTMAYEAVDVLRQMKSGDHSPELRAEIDEALKKIGPIPPSELKRLASELKRREMEAAARDFNKRLMVEKVTPWINRMKAQDGALEPADERISGSGGLWLFSDSRSVLSLAEGVNGLYQQYKLHGEEALPEEYRKQFNDSEYEENAIFEEVMASSGIGDLQFVNDGKIVTTREAWLGITSIALPPPQRRKQLEVRKFNKKLMDTKITPWGNKEKAEDDLWGAAGAEYGKRAFEWAKAINRVYQQYKLHGEVAELKLLQEAFAHPKFAELWEDAMEIGGLGEVQFVIDGKIMTTREAVSELKGVRVKE